MIDPTNLLMGLTMVCMIGFFGSFMIQFLEKELDKMDAKDSKIQKTDEVQ